MYGVRLNHLLGTKRMGDLVLGFIGKYVLSFLNLFSLLSKQSISIDSIGILCFSHWSTVKSIKNYFMKLAVISLILSSATLSTNN